MRHQDSAAYERARLLSADSGYTGTTSGRPAHASTITPRAHVVLPVAAAHLADPFLVRVLIGLAARAADDGWCRLNMRQLAAVIFTDADRRGRGSLPDTRDVWAALYQLDEMGLIEGRRNPAYAQDVDALTATSWYQDVPARFWRVRTDGPQAAESAESADAPTGGEGGPQ